MAEMEEAEWSEEAIRARIAKAQARQQAAGRSHDAKRRRADEVKQRKGRVNEGLLRGTGAQPREPRTFRVRLDLASEIERLAHELSAPRARVSIADLMEEAMLWVIERYRSAQEEMGPPNA